MNIEEKKQVLKDYIDRVDASMIQLGILTGAFKKGYHENHMIFLKNQVKMFIEQEQIKLNDL